MNDQIMLPDHICDTFRAHGIDLRYYSEVDSTNKLARELAAKEAPKVPVVLIAEGQTQGRGRLGRSFYSPSSTGLYMTLLVPITKERGFNGITAIAAVVTRRAISYVMSADTLIKWVNDIYLGERKVAGILAESFLCGDVRYVAMGIGINLCTNDFPPELSSIAGALRTGSYEHPEEARADALALAYHISVGMLEAFENNDITAYIDEYRSNSCVIGREIEFTSNGATEKALAVGIDDNGGLIVRTDGTEKVLIGGEISVKIQK